jgi:RHS repeat-associated protein
VRDGGTLTWYEHHYPLGEIFNEEVLHAMTAGAGDQAMSWKPNFRFPGQYEDSDMGTAANSRPLFVQNHYREYMPRLGRYNRVDPLNPNPGREFKEYIYVNNNPLLSADFYGLLKSCCHDDIMKEIQTILPLWHEYLNMKRNDPNFAGFFGEAIKWWQGKPSQVCFDLAEELAMHINTSIHLRCCIAKVYFKYSTMNSLTGIYCNRKGKVIRYRTFDPTWHLLGKPRPGWF